MERQHVQMARTQLKLHATCSLISSNGKKPRRFFSSILYLTFQVFSRAGASASSVATVFVSQSAVVDVCSLFHSCSASHESHRVKALVARMSFFSADTYLRGAFVPQELRQGEPLQEASTSIFTASVNQMGSGMPQASPKQDGLVALTCMLHQHAAGVGSH